MNHTSKSAVSIHLTDNLNDLTDRLKSTKTNSAGCQSPDIQSTNRQSTDSQSAAYSETYFDALYSDDTDPWQYQTRWYEKRKRDICLAVLPQPHYHAAIELGCGNGVFSELLAHRCQALVSIDGNAQAVQLAKQRLAESPQIRILQGIIPDVLLNLTSALIKAYPLSVNTLANKPSFDLIVISEILYYLSLKDIDTVIAWVQQHLALGGTLLCCHWRYPIDGFRMNGETVHQRLHQSFNSVIGAEGHQAAFNHQSQTIDSDFLLDVWQRSPESVAMQENLI